VELALQCPDGTVYAIEKNPLAVELVKANAKKFRTANIQTMECNVKDVVNSLPSPDVVFVGGSSGELSNVLDVALEKNPHARVVVNSVTLETLSQTVDYIKSRGILDYDVTQIGITRTHSVGKYSMLKAENPVYVISFGGGASE
jgi:precorrin-6Y C5,15-methyltransferase (decarboxylating)